MRSEAGVFSFAGTWSTAVHTSADSFSQRNVHHSTIEGDAVIARLYCHRAIAPEAPGLEFVARRPLDRACQPSSASSSTTSVSSF